MIPKQIYYCWFGSNPLPNKSRQYISKWQRLNPNFKIYQINEQNFDVNYCQFTKIAYQAGNMAFVSDVARILAIYQNGGFYFDTDVEELKPLNNLIHYRYFWAKEDVGMVASGLGFGAEAGNEILSQILNSYQQIRFQPNDLTKVSTVKIVSAILKKYGLQQDRRTNILSQGGIAFSPLYFAPLHYWGGGKIYTDSICVHHYSHNNSWTAVPESNLYFLIHQIMFYCPVVGRLLRWGKALVH